MVRLDTHLATRRSKAIIPSSKATVAMVRRRQDMAAGQEAA